MNDEFLGLSMDLWALLLKIAGPIAATVVTYQQRRFFARPRAKLRADLEILPLLSDTTLAAEREILLSSIKTQIATIFGSDDGSATQRNWPLMVGGLLWAAVFWYWTYRIFTTPTANGWAILTVWLGLAGFGWTIMGWQGRQISARTAAGRVDPAVPVKNESHTST